MNTDNLERTFAKVSPVDSPRRRRLWGGVLLAVAGGLAARSWWGRGQAETRQNEVDEALDDSFPASDPPSFTRGEA